jgi:sugar phosphate isomerase/epimerase
MSKSTRHYHIEDIAATRVHEHLIPGTGAIDFPATLAAISRSDYQGWLTVELYPYIHQPDEAARQAAHFLLQIANQIGISLS